MDWLFLVCYVSTACGVMILSLRIKKIKFKLANGVKIYKQDLLREILKLNKKITDIRFEKGDYYAYDSVKKIIRYEDKEIYTYFDVFALCHEIGHMIDDLHNCSIFYNMMLTAINRLFFIPIYVLFTIIAMVTNQYFVVAKDIILIISVVLFLHRFFFIFKYEISASNHALALLSQNDADVSLIRVLAKTAVKQQFILAMLGMMTLFFIKIVYYEIKV